MHEWLRKDKTARMTTGLTLTDEMLKMSRTLQQPSRCVQKYMSSNLQSMDIEMHEKEIAMTVLNELPL
eukprot:IDg12571t1